MTAMVTTEEALERWRNSDGFACSDKTDDGVMECLVALAQLADDLDSQGGESLRIANGRIADLEGGLTTLHLQFGETYYSWQRVLYRVQQLIRRRNACAEGCLNAIGFLDGNTTITKAELTQRLVDAVKPIVTGDDEQPEFSQGITTNSVSQSYSAPEIREPMRLIQDDDSHWYIIPECRQDDFAAWCKAMAESTTPPSDWEPERINRADSIRILDYENLDV